MRRPWGSNAFYFNQNLDMGQVLITWPSVNQQVQYNPNLQKCNSSDAQVGDNVVILGYPDYYGVTPGNILATYGTISGTQGDYYIVSGGIEHGDSGGAAILEKSDCYLGIPTLILPAYSGDNQYVGAVLDVNSFFP